VVCAQPFACLPNHVTGRGMFREIQRRHPEANVVAIDYDPGASEVNQLNRITLLVTAAKRWHAAQQGATAVAGAPEEEGDARVLV
jgi:predicted nucleotide-binding protein (sugar kinase/HSP70/actin superfamily)